MMIEAHFLMTTNDVGLSNKSIQTDKKELQITIEGNRCIVYLEGDSLEELNNTLYIVWELFAWYDGYFFELEDFLIDGIKNDLTVPNMYHTSTTWISEALQIGRNTRCFSEELIKKYTEIRNKSRKDKSMNCAMINSYFYDVGVITPV